MKTKHLLLLGLVVAFSSCSTAYRTGQTPDDVYYSPAPVQETYVTSNNQDDRNSYAYRDEEEQEIRRGIQDSRYRNDLSSNITFGLGYGYNPYSYSPFGYGYNPYSYNSYGYNPYSYKGIYDPYGYNNYGYYPSSYGNYYGGYGNYGNYYPPVYSYPGIGSISSNTNNGPRKVNLSAFSNSTTNSIIRANTPGTNSVPVRTFTSTRQNNNTGGRQQGTGVGNVIRRVFTPSENRSYTPSNNRTYDNNNNNSTRNTAPVRTIDNTPSTNTNSSSSGSSSAPVRTFRK